MPALRPENDRLRHLTYLGVFLVLLVVFGGEPTSTAVFIAAFFTAMAAVDAAVDYSDLHDRTTGIAYALVLVAIGVGFAVQSAALVGLAVVAVGVWVLLDSVTTILYAKPTDRHEFVRQAAGDRAETMLRLQTASSVYHALRDADTPRTTAELADELDLTESRVYGVLSYLDYEDRVEAVDGGYRATPSRWGRLQPVVSLARWIPCRVARPVTRLART